MYGIEEIYVKIDDARGRDKSSAAFSLIKHREKRISKIYDTSS
jgi:hypothetical protein